MPAFDSRPYEPRDLCELLALITSCARARWPECAYLLTSDFLWQGGPSASGADLRLWRDGGGLAAWAWFEPPTLLRFDARADVRLEGALGAELLAWGEERRRGFAPGRPRFADVRSMAEWEQELRAADGFDPELDLVLELADGAFAGYCIAWVERALGIGSFEPVGTRRAGCTPPSYRPPASTSARRRSTAPAALRPSTCSARG